VNSGSGFTTFRTPAAFRAWLRRNHRSGGELIVRTFRVHASGRGMTYAQALDEALCWGWIDGIRRSVDADSFSTRFTARRKGSIWSLVNIRHVERLKSEGRMQSPGLAAFEARDPARSGVYSFEQRTGRLGPELERRFRRNAAAWKHFKAMPPGYRRTAVHWVTSAKREETRLKRLEVLIRCSADRVAIPLLRRT
jgi:uncharacterized protein YdeI (YjbR/CyaY-like superfamily)